MCIAHDKEYNVKKTNRFLEELGLRDSNQSPPSGVHAHDIIDIVDDCMGLGFPLSTQEELGNHRQCKYSMPIVVQ